jgi:L-lactate dehydrogenase complex protein LldF
VLTNLDRYLEEAEDSLTENGVHVHWAETAAGRAHGRRAHRGAAGRRTRVMKAKSMLTEEIGLNAHLEARGLDVREDGSGRVHRPAVRRAAEPHRRSRAPQEPGRTAGLFHERLGTPFDAAPEVLAATARETLRDDFLPPTSGISGANFLAADTGTIALIENEGNIRISPRRFRACTSRSSASRSSSRSSRTWRA